MEGSAVADPVPAVEGSKTGPEITSDAMTTGSTLIESTTINGSGRDGSATPCPWSLTYEQQVCNLKENWKWAFNWNEFLIEFGDEFETNPWFASVVTKLQDVSCLDSCEFEFDQSLIGGLVPGVKITPLDLAILMGDLKMVQKILECSSLAENVIRGSLLDIDRSFSLYHATSGFIEFTMESFFFTPLHLAVAGGNSHIVDALLEKGANVNAQNWLTQTPLDLACKMGNVTMLQQLLAKDTEEKKDPHHVAVRNGDVDFLRRLPSQNVNALDCKKRTPLHCLAAKRYRNFDVMTNIVQYLVEDRALHVKALDSEHLSAFYVAVLYGNTEFVIAFLDSFRDEIRLNEACDKDLGPPIQIAFEGGEFFKDIESALMECDPVKGYMGTLYRDRQVYVDAANAILVGAAVIASVTFASWLQPPLNYTSYSGEGYSSSSSSDLNYADVEHNIALRAFWVFNALSFYFAIATVVCGARSVLPRSHLFIKKTVEKLRTNLLVTSILLACSVLFVIIAFAIAGTIVLTPLSKFRWCMIAPTLVGGTSCITSLVFLFKSMREIYSNTREKSEVYNRRGNEYLKKSGYTVPTIFFDS